MISWVFPSVEKHQISYIFNKILILCYFVWWNTHLFISWTYCGNSTWHICRTDLFILSSITIFQKTYLSCSKTSIVDDFWSLSIWSFNWIGLFAQARYLFEVQRSNNTNIWHVLWANTKVKTSPCFFPHDISNNRCAVIHMYTCTKHLH